MAEIRLRPELRWFVSQLELRLRENESRGGWEKDSYKYHIQQIVKNIKSISFALMTGDVDEVITHCLDGAAYFFFVAFNCYKREGHDGSVDDDAETIR